MLTKEQRRMTYALVFTSSAALSAAISAYAALKGLDALIQMGDKT